MQATKIEGFRLSPQQKYLWCLQAFEQGYPYRVQCAVRIEGNLNKDILTIAIQNVVCRHEILRTTFHCLPGMTTPLQVIAETCQISLSEHDLRDLHPEQQEIQSEALFQTMLRQPFNFEKGSIFEFSLIKLSSHKHKLLLSLPAMNADGTTLKNLVREINFLYSTGLQGEQLGDEPMQYADIAEWQNELLESEETHIGKEYWRNLTITDSPKLNLPFEKKVSETQAFQPQFLKLNINPNLAKKIKLLSQKYETEFSQLLLACWQILILRLTRETHIIVGLASDGRKYEELEPAFGPLCQYLPLQNHLEADLKFSEVLEQVEPLTNEVHNWQEYFSWEALLDSNENIQGFTGLPFCFEFIDISNKYESNSVLFVIEQHYTCTENFKVKLSCVYQEDSLVAQFYYDSRLFSSENIQGLSKHFETLLESAINNPEAEISQLDILSESAQYELLIQFNSTQTDYPKDQCIHNLFEEQAECHPNNIAVVFENQKLTYAELNARANQVAEHLQELGVDSDVIVGICLERSLEMIVGMLGVLKAGGAYLPIELGMPAERIALMLQDAQVSVLLTQENLLQTLPKHSAEIVCIDRSDSDKVTENGGLVTSKKRNNLTDLAYVIYTSGSTGTPKGVAIEHRNLSNYLHSILERLKLPAGASFATVSTFAADLGNTAIFPALCTGGCLHIISQERATDPEALAEYFRRHPIDCLKIVPSHLAALLTSSNAAAVLPRQRLILGGEAVSWNLIEKVHQYAPNCLVFNHYGPTEATVGVLTYQVNFEKLQHDSETVPLGRPIANTQIYILDSHQQPMPLGVAGELYIGGDNLARGYLNRPELTAEKFIANPFNPQPNARLYKTGDLACYLPDGNIEFLGRIDSQVKIRGFRIELGEIEATLRQHPDVEQAVVIDSEDVPGDKRLVAYIVPKEELIASKSQVQSLKSSEFRNLLQEKLPVYMVPAAFVILKILPLTANGKIDRQKLSAADKAYLFSTETFLAPRTPIEEKLADIWAEVLHIEKISISENFFELGGHSLLATQVISRLRQAFQIELPLTHLFEFPTIAALAEIISQKIEPPSEDEMFAQMLAELEQLSEEDVQKILAKEGVNK
ncbi:non-ribosomal peptide synthetase [Microcoleus sp. FACHB-672]|uniref:non-ribosomal peptide synthetase n=1 Tax=Microcoleus sp. FACHB-672 TaxID=2692825 RepID=UPI001682D47F|nr:non-ribosomal peptide synthetase [Microcoleus sp. FACHB-672]MBD2040239.1 amino acid adenylation domain-containing protein [Microcoleus sp. FACHB-672]